MEITSFVKARVDEDLQAEVGIDIATYDVLLHTREAGEAGVRMTDLADRVLLTKGGLTTRVDRLEQRGLVARVDDPDDRRVTRVVLTPTGTRQFRDAAAVHDATVERWFRSLVDQDAAAHLAEALDRVREAHTRREP